VPIITYVPKAFGADRQAMIDQANLICTEYAAQGFDLTLRQLYYQFVSRGLIANRMSEYKRLGDIINDARLGGAMDWDYIVDRTRNLRDLPHWTSPESILNAVAAQYRTHRWARQPEAVEVWIEKDALIGVIQGVCETADVPYFSCRGYVSQSEMWSAAQRHRGYQKHGQQPIIIHLGDHDPSGIDMSRDIQDRLALFGASTEVIRIALTMAQIDQYQPPPNPAKITDSRAEGYIEEYGTESWELDALDPATLAALITDEIDRHRDQRLWDTATNAMLDERFLLGRVADRWADVTEWLRDDEAGADDADDPDA
jgi:hypothetical protein